MKCPSCNETDSNKIMRLNCCNDLFMCVTCGYRARGGVFTGLLKFRVNEQTRPEEATMSIT
jgi:Zn ribbon nucleic-acid-binding protein